MEHLKRWSIVAFKSSNKLNMEYSQPKKTKDYLLHTKTDSERQIEKKMTNRFSCILKNENFYVLLNCMARIFA